MMAYTEHTESKVDEMRVNQNNRILVKETLQNVTNNRNKKTSKQIDSIEKYIYDKSSVSEYLSNAYQVIGDILNGIALEDVIKRLEEEKLGWKHDCFSIVQKRIEERDNFIVNPFEVEKGVLQCKKCGSERVFSYSKQVRSGDESSTTFAQCVACKASWVYSG